MTTFLNVERKRQAELKVRSQYFSDGARLEGMYKSNLRSFCLPQACAEENLHESIRTAAMDYFACYGIRWHDGVDGKPSNHLCSSQVCCVNFLFPFADKPDALTELLRPVFPVIRRMLCIETHQYVAFEWIGAENYLRERVPRSDKRTRGANFTSADAAVMFEREDRRRQIVLIEWKYTESYSSVSKKISRNSTDRSAIYAPLYQRDDCPLDKDRLPSFEALFYEPFYQFMRQQFMAHEMERAKEGGADMVSVLHIAPAHNHDFQTVTSPELRSLGTTAVEVWKRLVKPSDRFVSSSTERLFGNFPTQHFPELADWWTYINERYVWLTQ